MWAAMQRLIQMPVLAAVLLAGFFSLGCASRPAKPDSLTALNGEDGETEGSIDESSTEDERSGDGGIRSWQGATRPEQISGPVPSLSPAAISAHVSGVWVARCTITDEGLIRNCKILKGLPHTDEYTLRLLQAQRYKPVMFEGKPQSVRYTFVVRFR